MKKVILFFVMFVFLCTGSAFAKDFGHGHKKQGQKFQTQQRYHGDGYRYQYRGHRRWKPQQRSHYRGHWNSWRAWEDYKRHNHHRFYNQRYFKDERGSLYFGFDTPEGRFVFSIGR